MKSPTTVTLAGTFGLVSTLSTISAPRDAPHDWWPTNLFVWFTQPGSAVFTAWHAADDRLGEHQRVEVGADRVELGQTLPATEGPADRPEQGGAALDEFGRPVVGPEDHILVHEGAEEQRGARLPGSWRGKVDQEYLDKRGDTSVRLNEVVRVSGKEVRLLVLVRTMPEGRSQLD